jgi:hypothetical protein
VLELAFVDDPPRVLAPPAVDELLPLFCVPSAYAVSSP